LRSALPPKARETLDLAAKYFPNAAWARDAKYQLRNDRAIVYTEEWERLEDSRRVRFKPFAMIWKPEQPDSGEEPMTIECDSAVVEFARKFEITAPDPGRVVGGALEGAVRLAGPRGLLLNTRNVIFSEEAKRAWSDHAVEFAYDLHQGRAQGLDIDLVPEPGPASGDKPAIAGARAIRLVSQVAMRLVPHGSRAGRREEVVTVTSDGSFEYELESHVASFRKNVRVARPTGMGQHDRLDCQTLTLVFEPEDEVESQAAPDRGATADRIGRAGNLRFRRLLASGPGTKAVSERGQMSARMTELTYDEQSRQVVLTDPKEVRLAQRNNLMLCQQVLAVLDEDGQVERAVGRGPGRVFRYHADPPAARGERRVDFAAQWNRQMRLDPDPASGLDLIELSGNARLERPSQMTLSAETIRLWITPASQGRIRENLGARDDPRANSGQPRPDEAATPKRLLAINQVAFSSAKLAGGTERLEIWFEEASGQPPAEPGGAPGTATRPNGPARGTAASAPGEANNSRAAEQPMHLAADRIRIRVELARGEAHLSQVVTDGHVRLTQDHGEGVPALDIQGEALQLWNRSETDQVVHIEGSPAHVRDRGFQVEGADIHFDRGGNTARVEGAGVLRLPVTKGLDGQALAQPQLLDIFWREKMNFDGQTARFFARVKTQLAGNEVACEEMRVTLSERVDFSEEKPQKAVDVASVLCRDGVRLRSHEYEANRLVGVRLAQGFEFSLNQATGDVQATGPGWFSFWRRGNGNRAAFRASSHSRANKPLGGNPAEWEYTRVDFAGNMKGHMNQRAARFYDRVRIVYGPVDRSDATFDEENLPANGGWMRCEELLITQRERPAPLKPFVMLRGRHNVDLEGRTEQGMFHVKAYAVSYDESKELYVISGDGKRDAIITREARVGAQRGSNSAQRMEFIPSRDELKIERATSAEGSP
jgi:hypothetical protein